MRRIVSSAALVLAIGAAWAAPATAGPGEANPESVVCDATFSRTTVLRTLPSANADGIAEIPADTWVSTECVPFVVGGNHRTCTYDSQVWIWAVWGDQAGYAHTGCLNRYNVH
ncbi:hypothetical protein [Glycomyces sp. NRRL B-16210]|uniref:hypothetical protein n=1 Tax=Glycomyces sp. NRRL B-16210 TaxID=1463821 RepID=UPI0004C1DEC4|nr:hypothetical protein [Glycomyces sp. NRRL B-16210]